jgi:hypothetical protein
MPIPAAPVGRSDVASTVLVLLGQLHDQVRAELDGLDDAGLHWSPGPGTNSIATIVTHLVGSEAETLRCVAGVPNLRRRDDEFRPRPARAADVLGQLAGADALIGDLRPALGPHRLRTLMALPTLPDAERRSGLTWLVGSYGHGREHVGHIQLTRQLYQVDQASTSPLTTSGARGTGAASAP